MTGIVSLFWVAIYSGAIANPELWFWVSTASWIFVIAHAEMTQNVWVVTALTGLGAEASLRLGNTVGTLSTRRAGGLDGLPAPRELPARFASVATQAAL